MSISFLKRTTVATLLASCSIIAFADDAPVYDVDSYPPQFDGQTASAEPTPATPQLQPMAQPTDAPMPVPPSAQQPLIAADQPTSQPAIPNVPAQPAQNYQSLPMDQRVARLEQQLNNTTRGDSTAKIDDMQAQVQALRGQVDELNHQIQVLQTTQKTMYTDLDKRVSQKGVSASVVPSPSSDEASAETDSNTPAGTIKPKASKSKSKTAKAAVTATDTKTAAAIPAATQPNTAEEQQIYQTAYSQIKAKKYSDAAATLQSMLQKYPSGQFAANAHYWLGELYGLMNKNEQAITEFDNVVKNYPDSPKIADAQLKLGLLYAAQFKWPDAKTSFKKVIANYPGTSSARLASEQLKQIKQTGH